MEKFKVLHIMPGFGGGISSHVRNIIGGADPKKIMIDVAGFTGYPDFFRDEVEKKGGKTIELNNVRVNKIYKCISQYKKILLEGDYDAVHLHLTDVQAAYFSFLSRLYGIKRIIVHAHIADQPNTENPLVKLKYSLYRKLTICAATDLASCSKIASSFRFGQEYVDRKRIMHIPNSINVDKYGHEIGDTEKQNLKDSLDISDDALILGNVGYFGYQKNHPFMLELASEMKKRGIKFVWLFIGVGHDFEQIKKNAQEMDLLDSVRFLGRRNDVDKLFQIMDVSILPSHYEGLPTVAIESQAAGTPIVVSDTVTHEIDMGLGLVIRLSLIDSMDKWIEKIQESAQRDRIPCETRIKQIETLFFTASTAAKLYTEFIVGNIKYYNLGDKIEI